VVRIHNSLQTCCWAHSPPDLDAISQGGPTMLLILGDGVMTRVLQRREMTRDGDAQTDLRTRVMVSGLRDSDDSQTVTIFWCAAAVYSHRDLFSGLFALSRYSCNVTMISAPTLPQIPPWRSAAIVRGTNAPPSGPSFLLKQLGLRQQKKGILSRKHLGTRIRPIGTSL
jgi:hypothetical protein